MPISQAEHSRDTSRTEHHVFSTQSIIERTISLRNETF